MGDKIYDPPKDVQDEAHCRSLDQYKELYDLSVNNPALFWGNIAKEFYWKQPPNPDKFLEYNFNVNNGPIFIKWMQGGVTNVCYNVVDRNINDKNLGDKIAFYWEGNDPDDSGEITYNELLKKICKFANALKAKGIKKGDKVAIYMPMILELNIAMLACARIGAVHSIVFGGFSSNSLADRIMDSQCTALLTTDGVWRGTKLLNLKQIADGALDICQGKGYSVPLCIVVRHLSPSEEQVLTENGASEGSAQENDTDAKRPCRKLKIHWHEGRDFWWHDVIEKEEETCEPEWLDAEDPLFMLYTSGSTGTPKGVLHTQAGYMLYAATTHKYVFDYHIGEVYWCTADVGWITGHTYVTYGPLANGATSIIYEGTPMYPDPGRFWAIVDKYQVSKFYTAPTAVRSLMKFGDDYVKKYKRTSLKVLGTVGEPINPEAWLWYRNVIGNGTATICDTFWQTETGGHTITPLPGATPTKPGSARMPPQVYHKIPTICWQQKIFFNEYLIRGNMSSFSFRSLGYFLAGLVVPVGNNCYTDQNPGIKLTFPFFGIVPVILSEKGEVIEGEGEGYLVFKQPWPGVMRTVYGNHERFERTYFRKFPGYYCTGDGVRRDKDGYLWITGRIDDMLNVSGHLLSTAEVESALIEHPSVAENAVVARPHDIKGECLYCFITLREGKAWSEDLVTELKLIVRKKIGPFAQPDYLQEAPGLPKTRSGKIMRRVLRKIAINDRDLGDVSTMADETVVDNLFNLRSKDS